ELPQQPNWKTFLDYACLVRSITHTADSNLHSALRFVSQARPVLNPFPNLRSYKCTVSEDAQLFPFSMFSHPGLKHLSIVFPHKRPCQLVPFTLPVRQLHGLSRFQMTGQVENLSKTIKVLRELPNLNTLLLPPFLASLEVLEACSRLPALRQLLSSGKAIDTECSCHSEKAGAQPTLTAGCFPVLTTLTIAGCAAELSSVIQQSHFPARIKNLRINRKQCSTVVPADLANFHQSLAGVCSNLKSYYLFSTFDELAPSFDEIQPLLSLKLHKLQIRDYYPLTFTSIELGELVTSLPKLTVLYLNPSPSDASNRFTGLLEHTAGVSIDVLPVIARACPNLQKLGILLNGLRVPTDDIHNVPPFRESLHRLNVGLSLLPDENLQQVALYLAQVLPANCQLVIDECDDHDELLWKTLISLLPAMRKMKELGR
ncbi:hypothetical protein H0H93_004518, partial [Arthromyces matolae]